MTKSTQSGYEHFKHLSSESFRIAQPPLFTGGIAVATEINVAQVNATILKCGKNTYWDFERRIRIMIACIFAWLIFFNYLLMSGPRYVFSESMMLSGVVFIMCALFCLFINVYYYFIDYKASIYFNREKREVYYEGNDVCIANWEALEVDVTITSPFLRHYSIPYASLKFVMQDKYTNAKSSKRFYYPFMFLAIAEWELIHIYMDDGVDRFYEECHHELDLVDILKEKIDSFDDKQKEQLQKYLDSVQCPKGSAKYFDLMRARAQREGKVFSCLWCIYHLMTLWKLPCFIAAWLNKHPRKNESYRFLNWSRPIPEEQWVKPTEELKKQPQQSH